MTAASESKKRTQAEILTEAFTVRFQRRPVEGVDLRPGAPGESVKGVDVALHGVDDASLIIGVVDPAWSVLCANMLACGACPQLGWPWTIKVEADHAQVEVLFLTGPPIDIGAPMQVELRLLGVGEPQDIHAA